MKIKNKLSAISSKGFTLVELLVVIGIIGLLAAVLMATIDPIEQFKKTNDSNSKNMAVDFANAAVRYYSTHNALPCASVTTSSLTSMSTCMGALVTEGELKASYTGATSTLQSLFLTTTDSDVTVCFMPSSKSQLRDSNTKYDKQGNLTTACASTAGSSGSCFWCAK